MSWSVLVEKREEQKWIQQRTRSRSALGTVAIEAGATVGETFRTLFETWGVVIPLGEHPNIGMGGHVAGGAFGFLCRQLGLAADYLYAVEVVTVDEGGRASSVVATHDLSDPHRDLWWAHTGGGAGNFGIVTRYWFRSSGPSDSLDASASDPAKLLPRVVDSAGMNSNTRGHLRPLERREDESTLELL